MGLAEFKGHIESEEKEAEGEEEPEHNLVDEAHFTFHPSPGIVGRGNQQS